MSQDKVKKIHLIYGCIAAVLIIALGIALILSCLDIYNSGARPYSPESIGLRFQRIAILVYACIAVIAGGIILTLVLPAQEKKPKPERDALMAMNKLKAKVPSLDAADSQAARKEQKLRLGMRIATAVVFAGLMVYPAIYFMDGAHFSIAALNDDIRHAVCITLIPAFAGLMLCFICALLEAKSISRETAVYKKAIAAAKGSAAAAAPAAETSHVTALVVTRCIVLAAAVCFIVLGIFNGGMKDVLDKAVAICTECIGLG